GGRGRGHGQCGGARRHPHRQLDVGGAAARPRHADGPARDPGRGGRGDRVPVYAGRLLHHRADPRHRRRQQHPAPAVPLTAGEGQRGAKPVPVRLSTMARMNTAQHAATIRPVMIQPTQIAAFASWAPSSPVWPIWRRATCPRIAPTGADTAVITPASEQTRATTAMTLVRPPPGTGGPAGGWAW